MQKIRSRLLKQADPAYAAFHRRICPDTGEMIGVRMPVLKKLAKEIAGTNAEDFLQQPAFYYEETMLQALVLGYMTCTEERRLKLLHGFIPKIRNWAICDSLCANLKAAQKYPELYWDFLLPFLKREEEFTVRFGIVMLLMHFIRRPEWYQESVKVAVQVRHSGYYVKMAAAWALAEACLRYPQAMKEFFQTCTLDRETHKMMLKKLLDSRRLSPEERDFIKKNGCF